MPQSNVISHNFNLYSLHMTFANLCVTIVTLFFINATLYLKIYFIFTSISIYTLLQTLYLILVSLFHRVTVISCH